MKTTVQRIVVVASVLTLAPLTSSAQYIEPPPQRNKLVDSSGVIVAGVGDSPPANELLQQATFDYSKDAALLRLKVAKLWIEPLKGRYFPVYILANPSALIPAAKDSVTYTAKELLNEFGGLLNVAFAEPWVPAGSVAGQVGPQAEVRIGAKYVQFPTSEGGKLEGTGVAQFGANLSWLVRLWNHPPEALLLKQPDEVSQRGIVSLTIRLVGNYLGGARYRRLFTNDEGKTPPSTLGSVQFDGSLNLFDEGYVAFGYNWSSSKLVEGTGFAGISLSRRPKPTDK